MTVINSPEIRAQKHEAALRALRFCFREPIHDRREVAAEIHSATRVCSCGCTKFQERVARHWGWLSTLLEQQAMCLGCAKVLYDGRLVVSESPGEAITL